MASHERSSPRFLKGMDESNKEAGKQKVSGRWEREILAVLKKHLRTPLGGPG